MTEHKEEQVMVFRRKTLEQLGTFQGLNFDVARYTDAIFSPGNLQFMPRSEAEQNPMYKQLIPYVLMVCDGKYLNYVRGKSSGEKRLVGNKAIGIGGHINPTDIPPRLSHLGSHFGGQEIYLAAVRREVKEEVAVATLYADKIIALINDDSNEVGQVHFGIVHLRTLVIPDVTSSEQKISQLTFTSLEELATDKDSLEGWSKLCVEALIKRENND